MLRAITTERLIRGAMVLAIALTVKFWYSNASVNDLWVVLYPTSRLVELVTTETFVFESYAGYINADRTFLIAGSCSGVNFWIAAFVMLSVANFWNTGRERRSWAAMIAAILVAYVATLAANTVRIAIAVWMHRSDFVVAGFEADELHRLEGIFVYFAFLLLLFMLDRRVRTSGFGPAITRLRPSHLVLPVGVYWAVAIGLPFVNGAYGQGVIFWEHAVFVVLSSLAVAGVALTIAYLSTRITSAR